MRLRRKRATINNIAQTIASGTKHNPKIERNQALDGLTKVAASASSSARAKTPAKRAKNILETMPGFSMTVNIF